MTEILLEPNSYPFTLSLAIVLGLFLLEIISLILGGSILAVGSDGLDADIDLDADFDGDFDGNFDGDFDVTAEFDIDAQPDFGATVEPDFGSGIDDGVSGLSPASLISWLGITKVPFLIWLISFLTAFGLTGLVLQSLSSGLFGMLQPSSLASLIAFVPALISTRTISAVVATIMPKTESSAMKTRFLGGHHGVITQGTARRGHPAEAKIKDRHGNTHYLRVEPLEDDEDLPQGTEIHVIRKKSGVFYAVNIT